MTEIGSNSGAADKIGFGILMVALVILFVALAQPAWRGEEMLATMRVNCAKVGGVMIDSKGLFGTTYECSPRYDK